MKQGLLPLKEKRFWEKKDFSHKATFGSLDLSQLPKESILSSTILNQGFTNKCTAFASCAIQESEHNQPFDPDWYYFQEGLVNGQHSETGYDLRTCMKAGVKRGFKPLNGGIPDDFKEASYFRIDDPYNSTDLFDDIRVALWIAKDEKKTLCAGVNWRSNWNSPDGIIPSTDGSYTGGHCIKICGFTEINGVQYLIIQN